MKNINKAVDCLNKVVLIIAGILLVGTVIACALQVLSRHVPSFKVLGMEELARMQFVWLIALGMSLAVSNGSHMKIDIIISKIPKKFNKHYDIFLQIVVLVFCVILLVQGTTKVIAVEGQVTPVWGIPYPALYTSLAVGATLCIINVLNNCLILISGRVIGDSNDNNAQEANPVKEV